MTFAEWVDHMAEALKREREFREAARVMLQLGYHSQASTTLQLAERWVPCAQRQVAEGQS